MSNPESSRFDGDESHLVTRLLDAVRREEPGAKNRLMDAVVDELHRMAELQMDREVGPRTLQPTALVNEAYLRLMGGAECTFENRRHFFGAAAKAMHRICVDAARRRRSAKRGNGLALFDLKDEPMWFDRDSVEVLAVGEALSGLEHENPELVEVVRLRYFVGLDLDETAEVLGVSRRTIANRWKVARAWLYEALGDFKDSASSE